jgi:Zn-dependent M28 family amino/carboxypeptidase
MSASGPVGDALATAAANGSTARLLSRVTIGNAPTRSIIADLPGTEPEAAIMLGAHLDSVVDGPGLNDNGSGVAALLEIGEAMGGTRSRATIRLAFWTGEELGLHGSTRYLDDLSSGERESILLYLNADMVASPNGFAGVYDEAGAPSGSSAVRDLLSAAVERAGGTPVMLDVGGGSDHAPFARAGIVTGGVFSGASEAVSPEQAVDPGVAVGLPADPCYHLPCDDGSKLDTELARILTAALADVTVQRAHDPTPSPTP